MADINAILTQLRSELGKPYVWGATGPNSFDCSGLVQFIYGHNGISLPRTSLAQSKVGMPIAKGAQQPGDLVFSDWEGKGVVSHVAIYVGGGQVIEAPQPGTPVKVTPLGASYMAHVKTIQRVTGITGSAGVDFAGAGGGTAAGQFDGITNALSGVGQTFSKIADTASILDKLTMPQFWVRVTAGVAGTALVFFGLHKLVGEVRS